MQPVILSHIYIKPTVTREQSKLICSAFCQALAQPRWLKAFSPFCLESDKRNSIRGTYGLADQL